MAYGQYSLVLNYFQMGFNSTGGLRMVYRKSAIVVILAVAVSSLPRASGENDFAMNATTSCTRQNCTLEQTIVLWALDILSVVEARVEMDDSPYHPSVKKCRLLANFYYSTLSASKRLSAPWWVRIILAGLYLAVEAYLVKPVIGAFQKLARRPWTKLHELAEWAWTELHG